MEVGEVGELVQEANHGGGGEAVAVEVDGSDGRLVGGVLRGAAVKPLVVARPGADPGLGQAERVVGDAPFELLDHKVRFVLLDV